MESNTKQEIERSLEDNRFALQQSVLSLLPLNSPDVRLAVNSVRTTHSIEESVALTIQVDIVFSEISELLRSSFNACVTDHWVSNDVEEKSVASATDYSLFSDTLSESSYTAEPYPYIKPSFEETGADCYTITYSSVVYIPSASDWLNKVHYVRLAEEVNEWMGSVRFMVDSKDFCTELNDRLEQRCCSLFSCRI